MKSIYTFGQKPGKRNFTVKDLQDLKGSGQRLTMCNPANEIEIRACVDAGIDTLTVWDRDIDLARELAPTHFVGTARGWGRTCILPIAHCLWWKYWHAKVFRFRSIWVSYPSSAIGVAA